MSLMSKKNQDTRSSKFVTVMLNLKNPAKAEQIL